MDHDSQTNPIATKHEYEHHPAADAFPMMSDEEYQGLRKDIMQNGQRVPITLWGDVLLDGRNRLRACNELNIEPQFCQLPDDMDPFKYVISNNVHRRHLQTSQRAMLAAQLADVPRGGDRRSNKTKKCVLICDAAETLRVSTRTVDAAKKLIKEAAPAVVQAVRQGQMNVSLASKLVSAVPDKGEQAKLINEGESAVRFKVATLSPKQTKPQLFAAIKSYYDKCEVDDQAAISDFCAECLKQDASKLEALLRQVAKWSDK